MSKHEKFLEFNGKKIVFLSVDGTYWIALKPICEALKVDVRRAREIAKKDPILAPEVSEQALQVSKNGKNQLRKMTCLPEEFIYGWIFSIRSDSDELTAYKKTCYRLLYSHFHGTITNRKELLVSRQQLDAEIHNLEKSLKEHDETFNKIEKLKTQRKAVNTQLNNIDKELIKQPELFN